MITSTQTFTVISCYLCGVEFALADSFRRTRLDDHKSFFCPNGHSQCYSGESAEEKAKRELAGVKKQLSYARAARDAAYDQAQAAARTNAALRGHLTRMRKKVAAGVCPVGSCRRPFSALGEHVRSQHEGWLHEHPEVEEVLPA